MRRESSHLELMRQRLDALYVHDERLRMTAVNQWDGGDVPRLHLARSAHGNLWRFRFDVPDALAAEISKCCQSEPPVSGSDRDLCAGLSAAPACQDACVRLLAGHRPVSALQAGPAYRFPATIGQPDPIAIPIHPGKADLLRGGLEDWLPDVPHRQPFMAVVAHGRAVSVCASARITPAAHEAGVETLPEYRRQGFAAAAVAAWAGAVRALGATPFYSTAWDNTASLSVARALGLELIGSDFCIT